MNVCVYTGAYIGFAEYGSYAPADLFLIGNALVIRFNAEGETFAPVREVTHTASIDPGGWFRRDIGVAVVPLHNVTGPLIMGLGDKVDAGIVAATLAAGGEL